MKLPLEIMAKIMGELCDDPCAVVRVGRTSREMHRLVESPSVWRRMFAGAFPLLSPPDFHRSLSKYALDWKTEYKKNRQVRTAWTLPIEMDEKVADMESIPTNFIRKKMVTMQSIFPGIRSYFFDDF